MGAQVGHEVARVHAVETVEEWIDAGVQVDQVNLWNMSWTWRKDQIQGGKNGFQTNKFVKPSDTWQFD